MAKYQTIASTKPVWIQGLHEKYGSIVRFAPNEVDVSDIESAHRVHSVKDSLRKSHFYSDFLPSSENLFNVRNMEVYRRRRRLHAPSMTDTNLRQFLPQITQKVNMAVERIVEEMRGPRGVGDVNKWFLFMATDVVSELTFGESLHMLELGQKTQFVHDLEKQGAHGGLRTELPFLFSISAIIPLPGLSDAQEVDKRIDNYGREALGRYKRLVDETDQVFPTLFTKMYKAAEDEETLTEKEIRDDANAYIVAGSDTTATTLTYLVYSICQPQHRHIKDNLLRELATLPADYSLDDLKALSWLDGIIHETLRLYPAIPAGLPRDVPASGLELQGHYLPPGSIVQTAAYSMHRQVSRVSDIDTIVIKTKPISLNQEYHCIP